MRKIFTVYLLIVSILSGLVCYAEQNDEEYASRRWQTITNIANQNTNVGSSRSYVHKALAMLYLEKDIDGANEILCSDYIANVDFDNDTYLLYWSMPALTALYYMFNQVDALDRPLLSAEAEETVKTKLYEFLLRECDGQVDDSINYLRVPASENHNMLMKITTLLISEKLADCDEYKNIILPCGDSIAEYYEKVKTYMTQHFDFMTKNAVTVEGGDTYVSVSLESVYNLYGFTSDETLKKQAKTYLDLYWIKFASESIDLIKAGAKPRCYSDWAKTGENWLYGLAAVYFGETVYSDVNPLITPLMVNYYPPAVVQEILNARSTMGSYEYIERNVGVGTHTIEQVAHEEWPVYYYDKNETITRYSYVTPDYIIGSFFRYPSKTYLQITSQNQFEGAVLKGDKRVYRYIDRDGINVHNAFLSMQKGDVLISTKCDVAGNVGVYISDVTESDIVLDGNWYFVELDNAYLAIRPSEGGLVWENSKILLEKSDAVFVFRFARKSEYDSYEEFKKEINNNQFSYSNGTLEYTDARWGNLKFSPDSTQNIRMYNDKVYGGNVGYTVHSRFSQQGLKENTFSINLKNVEYTYDLSEYTMSPEQEKKECSIDDVKIYGVPAIGNTIYAIAETQSDNVYYEWYYENPLKGNYEYICSGKQNSLYIDEKYENLNIKVRCRAVESDSCISEHMDSLPIKIRSERLYFVNASSWNKKDITIEKSGNAALYFDGSATLLEGNSQGYIKAKKTFPSISETVILEFDSKNSGGSANIAYINGSGGVGVNINATDDHYDAAVGDDNGGIKGIRLKSGIADFETVHIKIIITPARTKKGYVSIFVNGTLVVDTEALRNEITTVNDIYFRKEAGNGKLEISNLEVCTLAEEKDTEMFVYPDAMTVKKSVCIISEQAVDATLVVAYYDISGKMLSAKIDECSIVKGINYFEDFIDAKDDGVYAKVFLFDGMNSLKPLLPHIRVQYE